MVSLSVPALAALCFVAWFNTPKAPSILEVPQGQNEQNCTQYRTSSGNASQSETGSTDEAYYWRCELQDPQNYTKNTTGDPPRTLADADLLAQEQVAYWTAWIGFFTVVGLIALILTLVETRKMTATTSEIGKQQNAAYLAFKYTGLRFDNISRTIRGDATFENLGSTPAQNLAGYLSLNFVFTDGRTKHIGKFEGRTLLSDVGPKLGGSMWFESDRLVYEIADAQALMDGGRIEAELVFHYVSLGNIGVRSIALENSNVWFDHEEWQCALSQASPIKDMRLVPK